MKQAHLMGHLETDQEVCDASPLMTDTSTIEVWIPRTNPAEIADALLLTDQGETHEDAKEALIGRVNKLALDSAVGPRDTQWAKRG